MQKNIKQNQINCKFASKNKTIRIGELLCPELEANPQKLDLENKIYSQIMKKKIFKWHSMISTDK
jgi:hypothetical protein